MGSKKKRHGRFLVVVFGLLFAIWLFWPDAERQAKNQSVNAESTKKVVANVKKATTTTYKNFSGEQFKQLARTIQYPNLQSFADPPVITGNQAADNRIRAIAEDRGYVLTSIPISPIRKINEPRLTGDDLLQPYAANAWNKLKKLAATDHIPLSIISAYRSPEYQRDLFMQRLRQNGSNFQQIAAEGGEAAVIATLETAALPGYSRHHSGYTIDLWCEDGSGQFADSICYKWIHTNNYKKAKQAGWIPSYPKEAGIQGPEPEAWEYIWVGEKNLTK